LVDGVEHLFVHDDRTEELIEIDARAVEVICCADGTRDLGGILLAAVRRGIYRRASEVIGVLSDFQGRGLLADGIEPDEPDEERHPDHPLEVLPDFSLSCKATGTCCGIYSSVPFSPAEAALARALVPEVLASDADRSRGFMPLDGSVPGPYSAITMVDGHCPYLADDGRCRIQMAGGHEAKPRGCRIFPASFVDDGTAVRVSVSVECPCVLASVGAQGGSPLVPEGAKVEAELVPGCRVVRLPRLVAATAEKPASRDELRAWAMAVEPALGDLENPLGALWALADAVRSEGLSPRAAVRAIERATAPPASALTYPVMMLAARAEARRQTVVAWRSERDPSRELSAWLAQGARALSDAATVAKRLVEPNDPVEHERFYLRATVFGHHLVTAHLSVEQALRDRATRLLLARQLRHDVLPSCANHPAAPYPLTAVEAMMRGQGLEGYAVEPP